MKTLLFVFCFRLLAFAPGCAGPRKTVNTYVSPCDSKIESATNHGYQQGFDLGKSTGYAEGKSIGYDEGFRNGKKEGYMYGHAAGSDSVLSVLERLKDPKFDPTFILYYQNLLGDIAKMKHRIADEAFLRGKMAGENDAYSIGYLDGYGRAFDSIFDARVQIGSMINYPSFTGRLSIDYKQVASLLHQINGKDKLIETTAFSDALWEIHIRILEGLSLSLKLSPQESREVIDRYQEIHQSLSDKYYEQYRKRCHSEIIDYTKQFYDYRYYHSVDAFFDIVESGVCLIADMTFTYAKNSHSYCATHGFKVMGNICELLIGSVMVPIRDYTLKYGIMRDFEENIPNMDNSMKKILGKTVMEVRTNKKIFTETVSIGGGINTTITMEIETILEVGLKPESFRYLAIHDKQEMQAFVSDTPMLMRVLRQDYKVLSIKNDVACGSISCTTTGVLSQVNLQSMYNSHRDEPATLPESHAPIKNNIDELLVPIIIKIAEPALALPHSCYNLVLNYGNRPPRQLVEIECENAVHSE